MPFLPSYQQEGPWFDGILERSLVLRLAGALGLESPASADDAPTIDQMVDRTLAIYERGRALSAGLAERAGVPSLFFWQPLFSNAQIGSPGSFVRDLITPPTIDITRVLDGVPFDTVYLDGAHINERGAEIVAEAMLPRLLDALGMAPTGAVSGAGVAVEQLPPGGDSPATTVPTAPS